MLDCASSISSSSGSSCTALPLPNSTGVTVVSSSLLCNWMMTLKAVSGTMNRMTGSVSEPSKSTTDLNSFIESSFPLSAW